MKVLKPYYYDEFTCVGGNCIDTCCAGWNITIDDDTYEKYLQVSGEFGDKLKQSILDKEKGEKQFVLNEDANCPFLNKNLLCDIYINIGEDKLCKTCKTYPRTGYICGDIIEQDLSLSCPEIAKIMVTNRNSTEFCFGEDKEDEENVINIDNEELFNALIDGRCLSVDIMQFKEIPLWKRMFLCLTIADKIQKEIDNKNYSNIKKILELYQKEEYITNYIDTLESFHTNIKMKVEQFKLLLGIMQKFRIENRKFLEYLNDTIQFFQEFDDSGLVKFFEDNLDSFESYYRKKDFIYENYAVYHLYHYYMSSYKNEDVFKTVVLMVEGYSLMKLLGIIRWYRNGHQLSDDEQCEIIYSYSRSIEHLKSSMDTMYNVIQDNGFSQMAYLAVLIR